GGARPRRHGPRHRRRPRADHRARLRHRRARRARPRHERNRRVSESTTPRADVIDAQAAPPTQPTPEKTPRTGIRRIFSGSFGRNLGLILALLLIVAVGAITAADTF